jgi:iron complex transport system substrate-binding protein
MSNPRVKGNGIDMASLRHRLLTVPLPLLVALALIAAACGGPATSASPSPTASLPSPSAAAFPLTLSDDTARSVIIPAKPARIVSLAPSNTEIACAVGACAAIVGVTDFDDSPPSVKDVPKVVLNAKVDVEKVVAAKPDLILAAGNGLTSDTVIAQLVGLGYPVLTLYPQDMDGVYADITLVGRALGAPDKAQATIDGMKAKVKTVTDAVAGAARPRTFYEVGVFEGTIYAAGKDSFLASLISLAGAEPITGDASSSVIQIEDLVAADPQLILLGDATYDPTLADPTKAAATLAKRTGWGGMTAVREGHVVPFLSDIVATRPGPRIVDGLEALAKAIHPDRFGG